MIIVTGARGFIGQNLVSRLKAQGEDVVEIDVDNKDYLFTYYYHDFKSGIVKRVYHLGAISSTTETNVDHIYKNNIEYSIKLFEQCIEFNVPVSYASSASVYGNSTDYSINPLNYYALSKATVDLWVEDNLSRFSNIRGYRFFNVYGEGEDHKGSQASPVHTFINQAATTGQINIFDSSGDGERDFVYVGDVCRVMIEDTRNSGIFDLGTGTTLRFSELAKIVANQFNATIKVITFPDYLKGKYQFYTRSNTSISDFTTVSKFVNSVDIHFF